MAHWNAMKNPEGYDILRDHINDLKDPHVRAQNLEIFEELLTAAADTTNETTSKAAIANLDQQRQMVLEGFKANARLCLGKLVACAAKIQGLLIDLTEAFNAELQKLSQRSPAETVSKWTLESPVSAEPAVATSSITPCLPSIPYLSVDSAKLLESINKAEIAYITDTISLLTSNRAKMADYLEAARALALKNGTLQLQGNDLKLLEEAITNYDREISQQQALADLDSNE